jgi:hypothetical protein
MFLIGTLIQLPMQLATHAVNKAVQKAATKAMASHLPAQTVGTGTTSPFDPGREARTSQMVRGLFDRAREAQADIGSRLSMTHPPAPFHGGQHPFHHHAPQVPPAAPFHSHPLPTFSFPAFDPGNPAGWQDAAMLELARTRSLQSAADEHSMRQQPAAPDPEQADIALATARSIQTAAEEESTRQRGAPAQGSEEDHIAAAKALSLKTAREDDLRRETGMRFRPGGPVRSPSSAALSTGGGLSGRPNNTTRPPPFFSQHAYAQLALQKGLPFGNLCGALALAHMTGGSPQWEALHKRAMQDQLARATAASGLHEPDAQARNTAQHAVSAGLYRETLEGQLREQAIGHVALDVHAQLMPDLFAAHRTPAGVFQHLLDEQIGAGLTFSRRLSDGGRHFAALRKDGAGQWWNMDSFLDRPERLSSPANFLARHYEDEASAGRSMDLIYLQR